MKFSGENRFNLNIYEYLLILSPHEDLWNRIMDIKKEFAEKYSMQEALHTKPHLTLANFLQYNMMEPRIIARLQGAAASSKPVKIEMHGFASFPSHTIYINVTSKVPVRNLVKTIRHQSQRLMKINKDNKPHFMMEPHLTIARKLQPWQYEQGWLEYQHRNFTATFIAREMILLKREMGTMKYRKVADFQFAEQPVVMQQGNLFMS